MKYQQRYMEYEEMNTFFRFFSPIEMASNLCPFKFSTLAERKSKNNIYHEIFRWKMKEAPNNVNRFCDPCLNDRERNELVRWLRYRTWGEARLTWGVGHWRWSVH